MQFGQSIREQSIPTQKMRAAEQPAHCFDDSCHPRFTCYGGWSEAQLQFTGRDEDDIYLTPGQKVGLEIQIGYNTYIHWVDGFYIGTVPEPVGIGPYLLTMSFQRVTKSFVLWPFPWDATLGKDELEPKKKGLSWTTDPPIALWPSACPVGPSSWSCRWSLCPPRWALCQQPLRKVSAIRSPWYSC